jgi:hypothetical protein
MNTLFKDLTTGSVIYALMKGEEMRYCEGSIVSVSHPRMNMPEMKTGQMQMPSMQNVVDVTYSLDGKNFTDTVDVTASILSTKNPGALTLVSTEKDSIVRELHASLKMSENYISEAERELPKQKKRIEECKALISQLDTDYKERQENEQRFVKLEETQRLQGTKLDEILSLLKSRP